VLVSNEGEIGGGGGGGGPWGGGGGPAPPWTGGGGEGGGGRGGKNSQKFSLKQKKKKKKKKSSSSVANAKRNTNFERGERADAVCYLVGNATSVFMRFSVIKITGRRSQIFKLSEHKCSYFRF